MAIVNTDTKRKVSGDGATRIFSFPFKIYTKPDINVWLVDKDTDEITEMSLTSDYKVTINRVSEGGTIEFLTLLPPSADEWVFMFSNLAFTQNVTIPTDGALREESISNGMDRIVRLIQQNREALDRTIQIPRQTDEDVPDYSVLIDDAKEAAQDAADEAEGHAIDAEAAKTDAEAAKTDAEASAISAANAALALRGTSTTSLTIAPGEKIFTTQADKQFNVGHYLLAVDAADSSNYMFGSVTSYSGTTLTLDITATGGAGTISNWTIMVSGLQGAKGDSGTGSIESGTDATKSASPSVEDIYFASDTEKLYWCLSAGVWTEIDLTNNVDILVPNPEAGDAGKFLKVNAGETGYELTTDILEKTDDKASQAEAEAGTNNEKYMTPLSTKQSIDTSLTINTKTEKTDLHDDDLFLIEDSEDSNAKKKVKKSNISSPQSVVYSWFGLEDGDEQGPAIYYGPTLTPDKGVTEVKENFFYLVESVNFADLIKFKFRKVAAINDLLCYVRMWQKNPSSTNSSAQCKITVGSVDVTLTGTNWQLTPEEVSDTLDVSSLTDGTVYDGTVSLRNTKSTPNTREAYLSAVHILGA